MIILSIAIKNLFVRSRRKNREREQEKTITRFPTDLNFLLKKTAEGIGTGT